MTPVVRAGSVLSGGGSVPAEKASASVWQKMVTKMQKAALKTRLGIPIIYGIDAVHGNNDVYNATIFPHNVGLGATRQAHSPARVASANLCSLLWLTHPRVPLDCTVQGS